MVPPVGFALCLTLFPLEINCFSIALHFEERSCKSSIKGALSDTVLSPKALDVWLIPFSPSDWF